MPDFYTEMAAVAEELINEFGRSVTVTQQGSTPVDPAKPWRGQNTTAQDTHTGLAVFVSPGDLGIVTQNADNVKRAQQVALFAANDAALFGDRDDKQFEDFDTITDGTSTWKIDRTELLKPGDKRLLYMFEVSR